MEIGNLRNWSILFYDNFLPLMQVDALDGGLGV